MSFLNPNTRQLKPSATLLINQKINQMRKEGRVIYHFGFGQSPFPVPLPVVDTLKAQAHANTYLPTLGLPALRKQIAAFLRDHQSVDAHEDRVLIGPGSKELLFQSILMIDATYLIPKGSWVSYVPQTFAANKRHVVLETTLEHDFKLQANILEAYCETAEAGTKVLIHNSPNNPSGAVYSLAEMESLARVCRAYDIMVFSDEIYSQLTFSEKHAPSFFRVYPEKTFVFGGLSKVFAAGGYRLGFVHLPASLDYLTTSYSALFSETFSAVSAPIQYAAVEAFSYTSEVRAQVEASAQILKAVGTYVHRSLSTAGIQCTQPEGGFYLLAGFDPFKEPLSKLGLTNSVALANYLLDIYSVALLPGTDFYFSSEALIFRLAYVDFDGGEALKAYQNDKTIALDQNFLESIAPNVVKGVARLIDFVNSLSESK